MQLVEQWVRSRKVTLCRGACQFMFCNPGVALVISGGYSMFTDGKTSTPKEKPFSHTANIISKRGQTTWRKYIFPYFLLKWQKGKNERKCTNNSCIKLSWCTSLLLLITNPVIFSYWIFSAHMKTKINLGDLVTFLALKLLWEGKKLLLWI